MHGSVGYILKPINRYELYSTIETALYKHNLENCSLKAKRNTASFFPRVRFHNNLQHRYTGYHRCKPRGVGPLRYTRDEIAGLKMTDLSNEPAHTINYIREFFRKRPQGHVHKKPSQERRIDSDG